MVFVGSNGGSNGSLVEVASCSNTSNGGRMNRVYNRMTGCMDVGLVWESAGCCMVVELGYQTMRIISESDETPTRPIRTPWTPTRHLVRGPPRAPPPPPPGQSQSGIKMTV